MKLVIFGMGKYYENRSDELNCLSKEDEIVAFIDNYSTNTTFLGHPVYNPYRIDELIYDFVLIMSSYYDEMVNQLVLLGVDKNCIISFDDYRKIKKQGSICIDRSNNKNSQKSEHRILLAQNAMDFNGGAIALLQVAIALKERGYDFMLVTGVRPNEKFIKYVLSLGIDFGVFESYPLIGGKDLDFVKTFDYIIVNVYPSIKFAYEFSKIRPTIWWIHEPSDAFGETLYCDTQKEFPTLNNSIWMKRIRVLMVNERAKKTFDSYYHAVSAGTMAYALPDEAQSLRKSAGKIVFCVAGTVIPRKGQDIFIDASKRVELAYPNRCEFWIIGKYNEEDDYYKQLLKTAANIPSIKFLGLKNREEMLDVYGQIDVSVCSSRNECLQIVTVEGMMHEKICITTDATGMTDYISDGINGLVFKSEDVDALYNKMKWVIEHYNDDDYNRMRHNARRTYELNFSLDVFGDNLERELVKAKEDFCKCQKLQ